MSKSENRAAMPEVAAFVDKMRNLFGADCRVEWCQENGIEKGRRHEGVAVPPTILPKGKA